MRAFLATTLIAVSPAIAALPAAADSLHWGVSFEADGLAALGVDDAGSGRKFAFGDFDLALRRGDFGLTAGVLGVVGKKHESYGALFWQGASGWKIEAGIPRPAYDAVVNGALIGALPRAALDRIDETHSFLTFATMTEKKFIPFGVTVRGDVGGAEVAASVHYEPDHEVTAASVAGAFARGAFRLEGAVEVVEDSGTEVNGKVKLAADLSPVILSVAAFNADANGGGSMVELAASWQATDRFSFTAFHDMRDGGAWPNRTGLSMRADFERGISLTAAGMHEGDDTLVGAYLGWRF
ncbi:hypothetical protein [Shimia biformata]|uniref:hypothetical protein n=1 Tax=Shimia biformata TaxID=1294299 RepID=UPI00194E8249|nr:hypothetical protein [Shimia biformata]